MIAAASSALLDAGSGQRRAARPMVNAAAQTPQ
jgi:hypothetical protein